MKSKYIIPIIITFICIASTRYMYVNELKIETELKENDTKRPHVEEYIKLEESFGYKGSDDFLPVKAIFLLKPGEKQLEIPVTKREIPVSATVSNNNFNGKWMKNQNNEGKKLVLDLIEKNNIGEPTTLTIKRKDVENEQFRVIIIPQKS